VPMSIRSGVRIPRLRRGRRSRRSLQAALGHPSRIRSLGLTLPLRAPPPPPPPPAHRESQAPAFAIFDPPSDPPRERLSVFPSFRLSVFPSFRVSVFPCFRLSVLPSSDQLL